MPTPTPTATPIPSSTPQPTVPKINSLIINNSSSSQTSNFNGVYKASGKQNVQSGSNWLNPLTVTLNASSAYARYCPPGSFVCSNAIVAVPIRAYYLAIYDKTLGPTSQSNFFASVEGNLNNSSKATNGVLLAYGKVLTSDTTDKWYVWDPSSSYWEDITGKDQGRRICGPFGCTAQLYYTVFPGRNASNSPSQTDFSAPNTWTISFDKNFGSKNLYTAGYVLDENNTAAFKADIVPAPN